MMTKLRINYPLLSTLVYSETDPDIPGIKDSWFRHYSHYLNTTVIYQRHQPYPTPSTTIWATMHGQIRNTRNQRWWSVPYSWEITVCTILSLSTDDRLEAYEYRCFFNCHLPTAPTISNSFHHNPSHNAWPDPEYQESKMMIGAL